MPYCRVEKIRLTENDPRAIHCSAREFIDEDPFFFKESQIVCECCTGFAKCDHPTYKTFTVDIECFDDKVTSEQIILAIEEGLGGRYGKIEVHRKKMV